MVVLADARLAVNLTVCTDGVFGLCFSDYCGVASKILIKHTPIFNGVCL